MFDRHVVVDWSARNVPATGADSIWVGQAANGDVTCTNPATRLAAMSALVESLGATPGARVLLGFDASLGYPVGSAALLGLLPATWESVWELLADLATDDERNRNNRFEVAAGLNRRMGCGEGPFWGCPATKRSRHLSSTKPADWPVEEYRTVERRLRQQGRRPFSAWQLLGAGSVGSQTLTLLPLLVQLRDQLGERIDIWPFTTGLAAPPTRPGQIVVVEVWPTMFPIDTDRQSAQIAKVRVKDAAQVCATADALRTADLGGRLEHWFAPDIPESALESVVGEEGWVLGAGWDAHLR